LSIVFGTYPFVTSSDCSMLGTAEGVGLHPSAVDLCLGIVKAPYMTRVGNGPFPTEFGGAESEKHCNENKREDEERMYPDLSALMHGTEFEQGIAVRRLGGEFGATTGRPRRTGWTDLVSLRYAAMVNKPIKRIGSRAEVILTKLDVMDGFDELKLCTAYQIGDQTTTRFPRDAETLYHCKPIYETVPGWKGPISGIRTWDECPTELKRYVHELKFGADVNVRIISVGSDREQTIIL